MHRSLAGLVRLSSVFATLAATSAATPPSRARPPIEYFHLSNGLRGGEAATAGSCEPSRAHYSARRRAPPGVARRERRQSTMCSLLRRAGIARAHDGLSHRSIRSSDGEEGDDDRVRVMAARGRNAGERR